MPLIARLSSLACACVLSSVSADGTAATPAPAMAAASSATRSRAAPKPKAAAPADRDPAAPTYTVEAIPAWVKPAVEATPVAKPTGVPMHYRVIDAQNRLDGSTREDYLHVVRVVDDASGLSAASQLELEFDPSFQTFALHHVDVVRDGHRTSRIDRRKIQLLQRETQLERRMIDGRTTLSMVLDDVRVGDEIDVAYTVRGANPVFSGRYADNDWMVSDRGPVMLYQRRLLAPADRQIAWRPGAADTVVTSQVQGGVRETTAVRRSVPAWRADPGASPRSTWKDEVLVSEYADWGDVSRWGAGLFVEPAGSSPLVDAAAARIATEHALPADRLLAALDLVQKDVRYFGTEIGANTHRPASPEKVLAQRFGDCKDKVSLLLALLRRLDIAGTPVLVSTSLHGGVDQLLPSPLAFDHVIARVALDGQTHWLDATRTHQSGTLGAREALGFGRGLALTADGEGLVDQPPVYGVERMRVDDHFTVDDFAQPPMLEARIVYRGDMAEYMRDTLATAGVDAVQTRIDESYVRLYPKLQSLQPLVVEQSTDDDAVTLVRRFRVPEFWTFPDQRVLNGTVVAWSLADAIRVPSAEARHDAYAIAFPGVYTHRIEVTFPVDVYAKPSSQANDDNDARIALSSKVQMTAHSAEATTVVTLKTEDVQAADWTAYTTRLRKLMPRLGMTVSLPPIPLDRSDAVQAQFKRMQDDVRSGKIKPVTKLQFEAMMKLVLLDADIDGGRLQGPVLAQTLVQRGVQRDDLGRLEAAAPDFARALEIAPDDKDALNAAAVNALMRGRLAQTSGYVDAILTQSAADPEALNLRMLSRYLAQDYAAASADVDTLLDSSAGWQRGYPVVMRSLVRLRLGGGPAPDAQAHTADLPTEWPRPLVDWALGTANEQSVIDAARAAKTASAEHLCEAYFYLAERHLGQGDIRQATDYYRKVVGLGITEFIEDGMARVRLAALQSN